MNKNSSDIPVEHSPSLGRLTRTMNGRIDRINETNFQSSLPLSVKIR